MSAISDYAIQKSRIPGIISEFENYLGQANEKWNDYQRIEAAGRNLQFVQDHQNKIKNGIEDQSFSTQITNAYQNEKSNQSLLMWLNDLKNWAVNAYSFIMDFRFFVTQGQTFMYHVMDAKQTVSYHLNKDHFTQLLTGDLKSRESWKDFDAGKVDLSALLQLSVADPASKKLGRLKKKEGELKVKLKKDALYQYLSQNADLEVNRLYEMYSQLREMNDWKLSKHGHVAKPLRGNKFFFTPERQNWVDEQISKYMGSSLKNDNIRFYKTGDTIAGEGLIENKLGGSAGVSISSIKNGIKYIKNLGKKKTGRALKTRLKELFSYIHPNDPLAREIQKGAALRARDAIDGIVNALVGGGYIKK